MESVLNARKLNLGHGHKSQSSAPSVNHMDRVKCADRK